MLRLTVFADHDLEHPLAGGANVNLEENLRRFSPEVRVRLLCTWAQGLAERETVRGVEIFRFKGNLLAVRLKAWSFFRKNLERDTDLVWDEVDFSVPWFSPWLTCKPVLLHCLHFQKRNFFDELPAWKAAAAYALEPLFYKIYRRGPALTISQSTQSSLLDIGFQKENVRIVSPGLDESVFEPEERIWPRKSKTPVVASLSRLRAWKGVHFAIQAMARVVREIPEAKLWIIGTGPYEPELRKLARGLNLEGAVEFLGRLSEKEKMDRLKQAHVLTKTSGREGWGIDVLEANACLVPTVGWRVPGIQDSIQHEKTGFLVPFGETDALAAQVLRLLKEEPLRRRMALDAAQWARGFTWQKSAVATESFLKELVSESKG